MEDFSSLFNLVFIPAGTWKFPSIELIFTDSL